MALVHLVGNRGQLNGLSLITVISRYVPLFPYSSCRMIHMILHDVSWCLVAILQEIKGKRDQDLLVLPTDAALFEDPTFKVNNA